MVYQPLGEASNLTNAAPGWNLVAPGNELHAGRSGEQATFWATASIGFYQKNIRSRIPVFVFPLAKY